MRARFAAIAAAGLIAAASPTWSQTIQTNLWVTDGPVYALAASGSTLYLGGQFTRLGPATGSCLPLSDATGAISGVNPSVVGNVYTSIPDGSGGRFIGGDFDYVQGQAHSHIAHLDASGNVTSWNPGTFDGVVYALSIDPSSPGTLYAGGSFSHINGADRNHLAALDVSTGALSAWDPHPNAVVYAISAFRGAVYVGGQFSSLASETRNHLAAFDSAGNLLAWDPNVNGWVYTIVPTAAPPLFHVSLYDWGSVHEHRRPGALRDRRGRWQHRCAHRLEPERRPCRPDDGAHLQ